MVFQACAFLFAFAVPLLMVERIVASDFRVATKWLLAIISGCLGAVPLLLVSFSGAFLELASLIRLAYLVYALLVAVITGSLGSFAARKAPTTTTAPVESDTDP